MRLVNNETGEVLSLTDDQKAKVVEWLIDSGDKGKRGDRWCVEHDLGKEVTVHAAADVFDRLKTLLEI